jgi:hypothetical protein
MTAACVSGASAHTTGSHSIASHVRLETTPCVRVGAAGAGGWTFWMVTVAVDLEIEALTGSDIIKIKGMLAPYPFVTLMGTGTVWTV